MAESKKGSGLSPAPSSFFSPCKSAWKRLIVLTVNPLDSDVTLWEVKARNTQEAREKTDAGSHNFGSFLILDGDRFGNLVHEVDRIRAQIEAIEENGN